MSSASLVSSLPADLDAESQFRIAVFLDQIEDCLAAECKSCVATVQSSAELTLLGGGKRLRPALVVLSALALGGPTSDAALINVGGAVELIHMATLIHDDVIDSADTRRGKPTAASQHGGTAAILSGDVLLARAMRLLTEAGDIATIRIVSEAVVDLAEGEVMELDARGNIQISTSELEHILQKKTASLISCAARAGAMAAKAQEQHVKAMAEYGAMLGMAFQIADDMLDYAGDKNKTGKPTATDFREGQATFPLLHLMTVATADQRQAIAAQFGTGDAAETSEVLELVRSTGSLSAAKDQARSYAAQAREAIRALPASPYLDLLCAVTDFVVERDA